MYETRDQYLMRPRPRPRPITVRPRARLRPKKCFLDEHLNTVLSFHHSILTQHDGHLPFWLPGFVGLIMLLLHVLFAVAEINILLLLQSGVQPRLRSWGGPRFGSQHQGASAPHPAKGHAGCWVRGRGRPSRCEGPGVSSPENFWKLRC